jgi:tetratricopeptide (TPR) repeat protein
MQPPGSPSGRDQEDALPSWARVQVTPVAVSKYAVKLEPRLWRAHYQIGRIYRDNGHWNEAAGEFTAAVRLGAPDPVPYVALCELYRRWGVRDLALAIATLGTQHVLRSADVWFELGMAHDDLRHDADAIAAFTRALAIDPDHAIAKFQRGQAYFRTKATAKARADLEDFVAHPPPGEDIAIAQASKMLLELH